MAMLRPALAVVFTMVVGLPAVAPQRPQQSAPPTERQGEEKPRQLTAADVSPAVWGVLVVPSTPGPHPGVVLLPGSAGWRPDYAAGARGLSLAGFAVLALDYHAETGLSPAGSPDRLLKWARWQQTVRHAVRYLRGSAAVGARPIALVGYSAGAFLAVSVASSLEGVKGVVSYFGGGGAGTETLEKETEHFPPLLIIHGEADEVVPAARARQLRDAVVKNGGQVQLYLYPGAGHGFIAPGAPGYSEATSRETSDLVVAFLRRCLGS